MILPLFMLPATVGAALLFYGSSMLVAAGRRAGGCEVSAISNLLLKRDDQVGCPMFAPVDALEGAVRRRRPSREDGELRPNATRGSRHEARSEVLQ